MTKNLDDIGLRSIVKDYDFFFKELIKETRNLEDSFEIHEINSQIRLEKI